MLIWCTETCLTWELKLLNRQRGQFPVCGGGREGIIPPTKRISLPLWGWGWHEFIDKRDTSVLHTDATRVAYKTTTYTKPLVAQKRRSSFSTLWTLDWRALTKRPGQFKESLVVGLQRYGGPPPATVVGKSWLWLNRDGYHSSPRMDKVMDSINKTLPKKREQCWWGSAWVTPQHREGYI